MGGGLEGEKKTYRKRLENGKETLKFQDRALGLTEGTKTVKKR